MGRAWPRPFGPASVKAGARPYHVAEDLLFRLGETEYATVDPRHTQPTPFGTFYAHPDFPDRHDANQLCRVSCAPAEVPEMLAELERCYAPLGFDFRKVSGCRPDVWAHLEGELTARGWKVWTCAMMLFSAEPIRNPSRSLDVRTVPPDSADLESLFRTDGQLDRGFEFARSQFQRMGGEYLVGYLDDRPACCTGWFVQGRVARFRYVLTAPWARSQGCATSLIRHVQRHAEVRAQDGLVILVKEDGPLRLYHDLGFRVVGQVWEATWGDESVDQGD